jgi:cytochrome c5
MSDQHASPIKTPKQLAIVVVLAFVVPITIIILIATYVAVHRLPGAGSTSMSPEAVAERLKPIGSVTFAEGGGAKTLQTGEAVYNLACAACHASGAAGAPKAGDAGAWGPRIKQGYDTLIKHATEGFKAMPPKGGNADLDQIEVARAVAFMANKAGAKFKEPEAPAAGAAAAPKK